MEVETAAVKCVDFLKELDDFLDDEGNLALKAELKDHLIWCHHCEVVFNTTRKTIEIYRGTELYELPEELRGRLQSAIMSKCAAHKKPNG